MIDKLKTKWIEFFKRDRLREWLLAILTEAYRQSREPVKRSGEIGILVAGTMKVLDGDGSAQYIKTASGAGTAGDPYVPQHTIDGSVTANAGTNLNTSALATEVTLAALNGKVTAVDTGAVTIGAAIPAGSNLIGKMSIDQVTANANEVVVKSALPAGANAIGKLAANSGVDIGDVDVTSISAGDNIIGRVKISDGTDVALVDGSGNLMVNVAAGGAGDGSILDGVSSAIKASVLDYTNSNPLAVRLSDTNGDYVAAGAGTQYTEDAAAAADPVGGALMMVRDDALSGQTTTDGDNVAARGTDKGELYVKHVDAIPVTDNAGSLTVDNGGTFAVQATLAAETTKVIGTVNIAAAQTVAAVTAISNALPAGDNNIGNVDIVTVPADPFGANADAGSATGSISAKLRYIAATGIPVTAVTPGTSSGNLGKQEDAAHNSGDTGVMLLGVRNTAHSALTDGAGDYTPINVDAEGCVVVVGNVAHDAVDADPPIKIGGKAATSAPSAVAANDRVNAYFDTNGRQAVFADTQLPAALAANGGLKVEGVAGGVAVPISAASLPSHAVTNAGTFAVQVDGNALTALQLIDNPVLVDDAAFTPASSSVTMAGFEADEASTDSVDEGDAGAARMTLDRKVIVNPQPHTAGGLSIANFTSGDTYTALTNGAQAIKAAAGQIYGYYIYNPNSSAAYVMVYNIAAASVTVGTSTAALVFCIPATSAANLALPFGIPFDTAISCAAATTGGGNGAPSTALEAMFWYK